MRALRLISMATQCTQAERECVCWNSSSRIGADLRGMSRSSPDLPEITSENFEQSLSDQTFVEFFNEFLLLPVFAVPLRYDGVSAGFELLNPDAARLSRRIRAALQQIRSRGATHTPVRDNRYTVTLRVPHTHTHTPVRDNRYTVTRLRRDQTVEWLKRERLAFFLQSDCYFEFRLAKCLSQLSDPERSQPPACVQWGDSGTDSSFLSVESDNGVCVSGSRRMLQAFRSSVCGGPGEGALRLWMDIERLKSLRAHSRSRYLQWMKAQCVFSSSAGALDPQLLSRLGLDSATCWRVERLRDVQPPLTHILLLYWGQRFCSFPCDQWQIRECVSSSPVCAEIACGHKEVELERSEIQTLLEVLHTESRSGFFFTHFCRRSGQQLWENAVCFCSEVLQYRQLFYQSRFDPYRAQHMAQLLCVTYLSSGAPMSVCVSEEGRRSVLSRLSPAFEDLFDQAEQHALNILLQAWTQLSEELGAALHTVVLSQELRYAEAELFQVLQNLYTNNESGLQQECRTPAAEPAEGSRAPSPHQLHGSRLDALLRSHTETQSFLSFLEQRSDSLVLQCWLDVEQLKSSDGALLEERNVQFKEKYLSSNFLFGPGSPATEEQQTRLLQMCAGLQRVDLLPPCLLRELQSLLLSRLESRWLPQFLSRSELIMRPQRRTDVCEQQPLVRPRRRRRVWKASRGPMSISPQAGPLRGALSDPLTRRLFQRFLSARDPLLENDLLFWIEVQRYKELWHSRCDEAVLQRKSSIIISCFISSSVPPELRIHVPAETAELLTRERRALGPYLFRETQACVFEELLQHWADFSALLSSVGAGALPQVLEAAQVQRRAHTHQQLDHRSQEEEEEDQRRSGPHAAGPAAFKISWSYCRHIAEQQDSRAPADGPRASSSSSPPSSISSPSRTGPVGREAESRQTPQPHHEERRT